MKCDNQQAGDTPNRLTVGTYSEGNLLVVYEINRQVLPTAPSPTTTHLMVCIPLLPILLSGKLTAGREDKLQQSIFEEKYQEMVPTVGDDRFDAARIKRCKSVCAF